MDVSKKSGAGGAGPPFANNMIRTTLPDLMHGNDMFFAVSMDGFPLVAALLFLGCISVDILNK